MMDPEKNPSRAEVLVILCRSKLVLSSGGPVTPGMLYKHSDYVDNVPILISIDYLDLNGYWQPSELDKNIIAFNYQ